MPETPMAELEEVAKATEPHPAPRRVRRGRRREGLCRECRRAAHVIIRDKTAKHRMRENRDVWKTRCVDLALGMARLLPADVIDTLLRGQDIQVAIGPHKDVILLDSDAAEAFRYVVELVEEVDDWEAGNLSQAFRDAYVRDIRELPEPCPQCKGHGDVRPTTKA